MIRLLMDPRRALTLLALATTFLVVIASPALGARTPKLDDAYIVMLDDSAGDTDTATHELERKRGFRARLRFRRAVRGFAAHLTEEQAARLRDDPAVASVTPDRPFHALGEVALSPGETAPSGVLRMGVAAAGLAREASSANVAVLDTGIDLSHPDLNAVQGVNCVTPGTAAEDDDGHGTHVAGTISADNAGRGVVGVAPGTRTHAVKVLDAEGNGSSSQIMCGIDWVTRTRTDSDPTNDISVVNLSLGGTGSPVAPCSTTRDPLHRAICASTRAGVTYVVAAGNETRAFDNPSAPDLPAAYPEVLTVAAMSDSDGAPGGRGGPPTCRGGEVDDARATFSSYATTAAAAAHTVAAPGICIRSTWPGGGYATISGTSMAAPHVAGAVALCRAEAGSAGPCAGLSPAGVIAHVRAVAERQNATYGYAGDPLHPFTGRYYGFLAWAGLTDNQGAVQDPPPADPPPAGDTPPATGSAPPATGSAPSANSPSGAAPTVMPAAADKVAPTLAVSVRRQRLRTALKRGLAVALRCSEKCVATAEAWLSGSTARRLKLSRGARRRIARRSGIALAAGTRKGVALRLTRSARARLARAGSVTLTVRITVADSARNRRVVSRRVMLRR